MAEIRDELILSDGFSEVWNKYINQGEQAAKQTMETQTAVNQFANSATEASTSFDTVAAATQLAAEMAAELAESEQRAAEQIDVASAATRESAQGYIEQANAITAVTPSIVNYQRQIAATERTINQQNLKLQQALTLYDRTVTSEGAASRAAEQQRQTIDDLNKSLDSTIAKHGELNDALEEFTAANPETAAAIAATGGAGAAAASGGLDRLLRKVLQLVTAYISWKAIMGAVSTALEEENYQIRFDATFGLENGENALAWVREQANVLGRTTQEIADATTRFSRLTTNPQNIEALTNLADRFARFSISGDYDQFVTGLTNALRTGNLRQLSTETGISVQSLQNFGVEDALNAGDVGRFVAALEEAAVTIGITEDAYANALNSSQARLDRFVNGVKNRAQQAARGFLDAFAPAFDQLDQFLQTEQGATLFAGLASGFDAVGLAASYAVEVLIMIASFLADNWDTAVTIAAYGAGAFVIVLSLIAVAALAANWPILLLLGTVIAFGSTLDELGVGAEHVFEAVGAGFGMIYSVGTNTIGGLYNVIASFAEFFANVWDAPLEATVSLFLNVFDAILGIVENTAQAIDHLLGSNLADGIAAFRGRLGAEIDATYGANSVRVPRWENTNFSEDVEKFSSAGREIGRRLDNFDVEAFLPGQFDSLSNALGGFDGSDLIGADGAVPVKVKGDISLADEDLRLLVDLAERRYVADVNVRTLAPKLNVNVTNKNEGSPLKESDIADVVMWTLEEQIHNHSDLVYDY